MPAKRKSKQGNETSKSSAHKRRRTETTDADSEDGNTSKQTLLDKMFVLGFDGSNFVKNLEASVTDRQKKGKPPRRIRYIHYCQWAHALLREKIGPDEAEYGYPPELLKFIRHIAPGDVKGEIREEAFPVCLKVFCEAMNLPRI